MTLHVNGSEVAQGVLPTTTHPNEFTSWYAWNYQTFWVDLLPGTSNTIEFRTAGGDEFAVDAIRVSNINDLNAADAHRRVVTDLNPTEQAALKRFLVELDGSTLTEAALTGYRAWMAGLSNQPPQALQEPFDDPDGDGVRNLLEYALGGHPLQSGSESYPHLAINGNNLSLHYAKAANDLNYIVEISPDLSPGSWQTLEASESFDPETGLFSRTHILQTEADRSFLRLRVETIIP